VSATSVGVIAEGPIDYTLLPPLLERIATQRAAFIWPVAPDDLDTELRIRKTGFGGVVKKLRRLLRALSGEDPPRHRFYVIVLDRRTRPAQQKVRKLLRGRDRFILGMAIEEIEAWWLADRYHVCLWLDLPDESGAGARYFEPDYNPERDKEPKATLDELTWMSPRCDQRYGRTGNVALAADFVEDQEWGSHADLDAIETACPQGFAPFSIAVADQFCTVKREQERLV
jgi:hypothetical protein